MSQIIPAEESSERARTERGELGDNASAMSALDSSPRASAGGSCVIRACNAQRLSQNVQRAGPVAHHHKKACQDRRLP